MTSKKKVLYTDYTVKKGSRFFRPQPGCHLPNSPWMGIILLLLSRESLLSDIPAGGGEIDNLFLQCRLETGLTLLKAIGLKGDRFQKAIGF